ncbi:MAG: YidC/Oxa1 family membrane protein insertase [Desulfitobacteriia bacterium]
MSIFVDGMTKILEYFFKFATFIGWPSWGVAIILFTIVVKIILYPLTLKQMISMRKTAALQPKLRELQKKYGHDKQKLNQKTTELFSEERVNPFAGCFPLLIQLPILWLVYRTLWKFPYGDDPSVMFLGFNVSVAYGFKLSYHLILPLIAALTTYLMTKVTMMMNPTPSGSDGIAASAQQTQKIMLYIMPFFLAYIVITLPSGLGLYIVTMNIMSILQTIYIHKVVFKNEDKVAGEQKSVKEKSSVKTKKKSQGDTKEKPREKVKGSKEKRKGKTGK